MKSIIHERPGVYSSYDASTAIWSSRAARVVGVAAKSTRGTKNTPVTLTSYEAGVNAFGEDAPDKPGMSAMLRLLFWGGASTVVAVAVEGEDYTAAFDALQAAEDVRVVVCDSGELAVQQALRASVEAASAARRERIAVVGMSSASTAELTARAKALNSERMVLVGPDGAVTRLDGRQPHSFTPGPGGMTRLRLIGDGGQDIKASITIRGGGAWVVG